MLDRHHAAGGEAFAVAGAIDFVKNRNPGIARAQEIGVKRMADAVTVDGADGRRQCLAQHLTAEHALRARLGTEAAKNILLDLFQIEQGQDLRQRRLAALRSWRETSMLLRFRQSVTQMPYALHQSDSLSVGEPMHRAWASDQKTSRDEPAIMKRQDMANPLLEQAAHQAPPATTRGVLERLFTLMFQGFVYNQIWEDPSVDLEALELEPHHRILTIASGGCNVLNYLAADPAKIIAVDLNPNHVALTRLKLAALTHLPDHEELLPLLRRRLRSRQSRSLRHLICATGWIATTRAYWETTHGALHGRRIDMFARNLYRHGLLGRFIGLLHGVARLHGKKLERSTGAQKRRTNSATLFDQRDRAAVRLARRSD